MLPSESTFTGSVDAGRSHLVGDWLGADQSALGIGGQWDIANWLRLAFSSD